MSDSEWRSESEVRHAAGVLCTNRALVNVVIGRPTVRLVASASLSGSAPGGGCRRRSVVVGQRNRLFLLAELRVGWRPQLCFAGSQEQIEKISLQFRPTAALSPATDLVWSSRTDVPRLLRFGTLFWSKCSLLRITSKSARALHRENTIYKPSDIASNILF
jgi:hypothetical protein